jgi:hypothetical protein
MQIEIKNSKHRPLWTRFALATLRDRRKVIQIVDSVWVDGLAIDLIRSMGGSIELILASNSRQLDWELDRNHEHF